MLELIYKIINRNKQKITITYNDRKIVRYI